LCIRYIPVRWTMNSLDSFTNHRARSGTPHRQHSSQSGTSGVDSGAHVTLACGRVTMPDDRGLPFQGQEDRRKNRLKIPPCPNCGSEGAQIVTRVINALYARCAECGEMWGIPRPAQKHQ
jgi:predicted RNA-binding Zn-ribbon protein involved in translation (DUF1610 family)